MIDENDEIKPRCLKELLDPVFGTIPVPPLPAPSVNYPVRYDDYCENCRSVGKEPMSRKDFRMVTGHD